MATDTMSPFRWGSGGRKLTPEQAARQREIAAALMQSGMDTSPVGHWTQGMARVAQALVGRIMESRAERVEAEGRAGAQSTLSDIAGSYHFPAAPSGVGFNGSASISPSLSSGFASQPANTTSAATIPVGERADYIRQGLVQRGLPQHVADGFLANFQDESGLNPGINERNPIVPGSRGGFGLYQLTGPRRREYEAFAAERGAPLDDIDAQLDFLMMEGQGSEKGAFDRILSAPDTATAAQAIVNDFLRPAASHRQSRASRYAGLPTSAPAVDAVNALANGGMQDLAQRGPVQGSMETLPFNPADAQGMAMEPLGAGGVPVAETEADILAQEQAMSAQDPMAFAPATRPSDGVLQALAAGTQQPVNPVAQALTGHQIADPDLPMAGNRLGFAPIDGIAKALMQSGSQLPSAISPVARALVGNGGTEAYRGTARDSDMPGHVPLQPGEAGPSLQQLMQAASNPWLNQQEKAVLNTMLEQRLQQNDPYRQLQTEKLRAEVEALRTGTPGVNSSFGNLDAQARAAGLQPRTPEYQNFMLNGGGAPATFRALDMQAQAAGFQPGTPEYNEFMATRGAGLQAGAAQNAKNEADIATGGAAAGAKAGGAKTMEAGFSAWGDYGKLQTSIGNMDEAIAAIDGGAKSGIIYNMLPNITEASASLQNAMDRMGLDVIGSVTFGALSEGEMRLAMQTAAPRDLSPPELRNWLVRKRDAQIKAADMLADAAQYLTKPGNTINGWIDRNRAAASRGGGNSGQAGAGGNTGSSQRYRYNPETGELE